MTALATIIPTPTIRHRESALHWVSSTLPALQLSRCFLRITLTHVVEFSEEAGKDIHTYIHRLCSDSNPGPPAAEVDKDIRVHTPTLLGFGVRTQALPPPYREKLVYQPNQLTTGRARLPNGKCTARCHKLALSTRMQAAQHLLAALGQASSLHMDDWRTFCDLHDCRAAVWDPLPTPPSPPPVQGVTAKATDRCLVAIGALELRGCYGKRESGPRGNRRLTCRL